MAKNIPSPYLAAPPLARLVRSAGDQPNHHLYSLDDELVLIPLNFKTSGGALQTDDDYRVSHRVWIEDLTGGNLRIWHPNCEASNVHLYLTSGAALSITVDSSNAPNGYTSIAIGAASDTFQGYLAIRATKDIETPSISNTNDGVSDANGRRTLAEREREGVQSPVPGLCVSWVNFRVDAGGDPIDTSARGSLSYNVNRTGIGAYTITFTTAFGPGTNCVATAEGQSGLANVNPGTPNTVALTFGADPADQARVSVLILHPVPSEGRDSMLTTLTSQPRPQHARDGVYCSCSLMRDLCFIPVSLKLTGGNIDTSSPDTNVPPNVQVTKDGTKYIMEIGVSVVELVGASFIDRFAALEPLPIEYTNNTDGRVAVTTATTDTVITGWICAATNSER